MEFSSHNLHGNRTRFEANHFKRKYKTVAKIGCNKLCFFFFGFFSYLNFPFVFYETEREREREEGPSVRGYYVIQSIKEGAI